MHVELITYPIHMQMSSKSILHLQNIADSTDIKVQTIFFQKVTQFWCDTEVATFSLNKARRIWSLFVVRDIVHYWSQIVGLFIVSCISLLCVGLYNGIIDLFREGYQGLKSEVWQLIPRWSSGSVVWLMIIGLGVDSPHILIWKNNKFW